MDVLSVISRKGGTAKTTQAIHWGMEARSKGQRVIWVELDDQGSLVDWFNTRKALHEEEEPLQCAILKSVDEIESFIESCRESEQFDLVVLDTRPNVQGFVQAAIKMATHCVIVAKPSMFDMRAIAETVALSKEADATAGIVVTSAGSPALAREARHALAQFGLPVCPKAIMHRTVFVRATGNGLTVQEVDETSKASQEIRSTWKWITEL